MIVTKRKTVVTVSGSTKKHVHTKLTIFFARSYTLTKTKRKRRKKDRKLIQSYVMISLFFL